jgi:hypothetical protein
MAVVYGLIIVVAISTLDILIILNYKQDQLEKNQARQIMFAEIITNVVKDKLDDSMELNGTVRENSQSLMVVYLSLITRKRCLQITLHII